MQRTRHGIVEKNIFYDVDIWVLHCVYTAPSLYYIQYIALHIYISEIHTSSPELKLLSNNKQSRNQNPRWNIISTKIICPGQLRGETGLDLAKQIINETLIAQLSPSTICRYLCLSAGDQRSTRRK